MVKMAAQFPATVRQVSPSVCVPAADGYATKRDTWRALIVFARPWQWVKNGLVLAALVFSHRLFRPHDAVLAGIALLAFCALSSFAYVLNDIQIEKLIASTRKSSIDRWHAGTLRSRKPPASRSRSVLLRCS